MKEDKTSRNNLFIMVMIWICTSIAYYVTNFVTKYLEGNLFVNTAVLGLSECASLLLAGYLVTKFGLKNALYFSYLIGFVGGLLIILFEESLTFLMPLFIILTKFGIGSSFGLIYLGNFIFEVQFSS